MKLKHSFQIKNFKLKIHRRSLIRVLSLVLVLILTMGILLRLTAPSVQASWFDDTYAYRLKFTFTHNATISSERSVTFTLDTAELISANLMQTDCDDMRFTDNGGKYLPYDLTGTCNNASTTIEVIFPNIINGTNVGYIYYANPAAINAEVNSAGYTALTPNGGDPSDSAPLNNTEEGPSPALWLPIDEGYGTTTQDGTINNFDASFGAGAAAPTWQTEDMCVSGKCLYFDGGDYMEIPAGSSLEYTYYNPSISLWFKTSKDYSGGDGTLYQDYAANNTLYVTIGIATDNSIYGALRDVGTNILSVGSPIAINDGKWHHVVFVKTATTTVNFYLDGKLVDTATNGSYSNSDLTGGSLPAIGRNNEYANNYYTGFIDDVKIFHHIRSSDQIKTDFAARGVSKGAAASFGPDQSWLSNGLVGYWKMDEVASPALDSSGNSSNGTWTGGATSSVGKFGNGITLDGVGDYINVPNTTAIQNLPTGDFTVTTWIKTPSSWDLPAGTQQSVFVGKTTGSSMGWQLYNQYNGKPTFSVFYDNTNAHARDSTALENSTWYQLVAVFTATDKKPRLFINAVEATYTGINGSQTQGIGTYDSGGEPSHPLRFGYYDTVSDPDGYFDGEMDEIRLYNRALSPKEVTDLYNFAPGPVGYWKMDENLSGFAYDSSGNNNVGTLDSILSWSPGKFGSSTYFGGSNNRIEVNDSNSLDLIGNATLEAWIYWQDGSDVNEMILSKSGNYELRLTDDSPYELITVSYYESSGNLHSNICDSSTDIPDGWHHIAVNISTSDFTTARIYVDGQLCSSYHESYGASYSLSNILTIGGLDSDPSADFKGYIDEVKIYNYTRTSNQIIQDMNGGHPAGGSPIGSQTIYWAFDEGQGPTAYDTIGNENGDVDVNLSWKIENSTSGGCKLNGCLEFDAAAEDVVIGYSVDSDVDFNGSEPFSGSAWVYIASMPGSGEQDAIIAKWDGTTPDRGYRLYVENDDADTTGNFEVQIMDESTDESITASQSNDLVIANTWYHVSFTFNGGIAGATGDLKLYVDGKYTAQNSANASFLGLEDIAIDFSIGEYDVTDVVATNTAFTGRIDELKIYSGELSASDILLDMNAGSASSLGGVLGTHNNEGFAGNPPTGWWKLDDNTGDPSELRDSSGYNHSVSAHASMTSSDWVPGKYGSALDFDGSDDRLSTNIATSTFISASTGTIEAWFKPTGTAQTNGTSRTQLPAIIGDASGFISINRGNFTGSAPNGDCIYFVNVDAGGEDAVCASYTVNTWNHTALVHSGGTLYAYLNGQLVGSVASGDTSGLEGNFHIGQSDNLYFAGIIDEVKTYDYARSQTQIAYDYNRGAPVAQYDMDECSGSTVRNSTVDANGAVVSSLNGTINLSTGGNQTTAIGIGDCTTNASTPRYNGRNGKYSSSLNFDGTDDYVNVTNSSVLNFTGDMSVSVWIKKADSGITEYFQPIITKDNNGDTIEDFNMFMAQNGGSDRNKIEFGTNAANYWLSSVSIEDTNWHHIVFSKSGANGTFYIDGKQDTTTSVSATIDNHSYDIKIGWDYGSSYFKGQIDDVRLYNYPLSASQAKTLYNQGSAVQFAPLTGTP